MLCLTRIHLVLLAAGLIVGGCQADTPPSGPDQPPEATYQFSQDWVSRNTETWTRILATLAGKPNLSYLEIGVWEGRSVLWMLENVLTHPSSRVTALDLFSGSNAARFDHNLRVAGVSDRVKKVAGFSRHTLRPLPLASFDLIYVDGSHAGPDVLADAVMTWDLLKVGGIMILDDYGMDTGAHDTIRKGRDLPADLRPGPAIDAFLSIHRQQVRILHADYQVIIEKIPSLCQTGAIGAAYERIKYCSVIGEYVYFWNKQRLYRGADGEAVTLSNDERATLESMLTTGERWPSPTQPPAQIRDDPAYSALFERLNAARRPRSDRDPAP